MLHSLAEEPFCTAIKHSYLLEKKVGEKTTVALFEDWMGRVVYTMPAFISITISQQRGHHPSAAKSNPLQLIQSGRDFLN
jgi:hypothetical protein